MRGLRRVDQIWTLTMAAFNLTPIANLGAREYEVGVMNRNRHLPGRRQGVRGSGFCAHNGPRAQTPASRDLAEEAGRSYRMEFQQPANSRH